MCFLRVHTRLLIIVLLESSSCVQLNQRLQLQKQNSNLMVIEQKPVITKSCPPWKYDKYHNASCVCGDTLDNIVKCEDNQRQVQILNCHCMSFSNHNDTILVGNCPYLCTYKFYAIINSQTDIRKLCNNEIQQNRQGQMCGKCTKNFAPSPYSYTFECADCSNYKYNWVKYLAIIYLPLTLFYILVIIFRFNAMSASMNSLILICQIAGSPAAMSILILTQISAIHIQNPVIILV